MFLAVILFTSIVILVSKYVDETIRYRRLKRTIKQIKEGDTKMSIAKMSLAIAFPVMRNDSASLMHEKHSWASSYECSPPLDVSAPLDVSNF